MNISVRGIGWLSGGEYGCIRLGHRQRYDAREGHDSLSKGDIFSYHFKNFGRLNGISRMTAYGVALALRDAGIEYSTAKKQDIGIIGTNAEGSLQADRAYFRDYVEGGRTLSRGNLFIYTLPSSPIGEAAIHFGLLGPLLYAAGQDASISTVLDSAAEMLLARETPVMLSGRGENDSALFFVLEGQAGQDRPIIGDLADIRSITETDPGVPEMVRQFSLLAARKV
jgi:3-oxoacyl-[acyl-carrier-protein] synthase II